MKLKCNFYYKRGIYGKNFGATLGVRHAKLAPSATILNRMVDDPIRFCGRRYRANVRALSDNLIANLKRYRFQFGIVYILLTDHS